MTDAAMAHLQRMTVAEAAGLIRAKARKSSHPVEPDEILLAAENAIRLFKIFHSANFDHQVIQRELDSRPINALTLIGIALFESKMQSVVTFRRIKKARDAKESMNGKTRAQKKLEKDPKQKAKAKVRECWDDWQIRIARGERPYKSKAAFARDMLGKFEELENSAVIVGWCTKWETQPEDDRE